MRWDTKPDNRIRRTSSHPAPTRFEELLAEVRAGIVISRRVSSRQRVGCQPCPLGLLPLSLGRVNVAPYARQFASPVLVYPPEVVGCGGQLALDEGEECLGYLRHPRGERVRAPPGSSFGDALCPLAESVICKLHQPVCRQPGQDATKPGNDHRP